MAGSVLGSVAASVVGGVISKKSSDKAADAQQAAADKAAEVQKYMYDTSREDIKPFRDTGVAANNKLSALMGLGEFNRDSIANNIRSRLTKTLGGNKPAAPAAAPSGAGPTDTGGTISRPVLSMNIPQKLWQGMGYDNVGNYTGFVAPKPSDPDWLDYIEWTKTLPRGANAQDPNWKSIYQGRA